MSTETPLHQLVRGGRHYISKPNLIVLNGAWACTHNRPIYSG
jgi:hypothetical protein